MLILDSEGADNKGEFLVGSIISFEKYCIEKEAIKQNSCLNALNEWLKEFRNAS